MPTQPKKPIIKFKPFHMSTKDFLALSLPQRRVEVANDVLRMCKAKKYIVNNPNNNDDSTYLALITLSRIPGSNKLHTEERGGMSLYDVDVSKAVKADNVRCVLCAKSALNMSTIRAMLNNSRGKVKGDMNTRLFLTSTVSNAVLYTNSDIANAVEQCFEGWYASRARKPRKYTIEELMNNIIKNKGKFKHPSTRKVLS